MLEQLFRQAQGAHRAGDLDTAERLYRQIVALDKRQPAPLHLLGVIAGQRGDLAVGIRYVEKSLKIDAKSADAWLNLGRMQGETGDLKNAERSLRKAADLNPNNPLAFSNLVAVFRKQKRFAEALECGDRALALDPDNIVALINRGNVLLELERFIPAAETYARALRTDKNSAEAWLGLGSSEAENGKYDIAIAALKTALDLDPSSDKARASLLKAKMHSCDWDGFSELREACMAAMENGSDALSPGRFLAFPSTAEQQLQSAVQYSKSELEGIAAGRVSHKPHHKIRIGYFSADFRDHAVAHLTAGLFEHHDRSRFEVYGMSYAIDDASSQRRRVENAFDVFVDLREFDVAQAVKRSRSLELDIAIDLMGWTTMARTALFAHRLAPVQVNYLGYPGTMGASFMDYIVADKTVIPDAHEKFYSEKIAWLPDTYQANDNKREVAELLETREELGLPRDGFVFCCFNNSFKVTSDIFDVWMRLLRKTDGSVLWLFEGNAFAKNNLRKEAAARGIAPDRLVFAPRVGNAEHLARQKAADLFLDTLYWNAHTTASDALWAGLPMITCEGQTFSSRVASSLLRAVDMPELVTTSLDDYESLALKIAHDPDLLGSIRTRLASNRVTAALFDTARYTRHLEAAFEDMHERSRGGRKPASFAVKRI